MKTFSLKLLFGTGGVGINKNRAGEFIKKNVTALQSNALSF